MKFLSFQYLWLHKELMTLLFPPYLSLFTNSIVRSMVSSFWTRVWTFWAWINMQTTMEILGLQDVSSCVHECSSQLFWQDHGKQCSIHYAQKYQTMIWENRRSDVMCKYHLTNVQKFKYIHHIVTLVLTHFYTITMAICMLIWPTPPFPPNTIINAFVGDLHTLR